MLDHDDLKWIAANATELNRALQQVSRYSDQLRQKESCGESLQLLTQEVEQASRTSQALFDRITARIFSNTRNRAASLSQPTNLIVMPSPPPPMHGPATIKVKMPTGDLSLGEWEGSEVVIHNPQGERELVLVIDDEPAVLTLATAMLEAEDYRIIVARDGFEALRIYQQMKNEIALVILDYFLPVMDGDTVFDELKAINPEVHVVLSSGFAEQSKIASMLARGLRGFIPKPYTQEKLLDQVRLIIEA